MTDAAGNLMNQNGNAVNGEAADVYNGTVVFAATVTTLQAPEGFEGWSDGAVPSQWSLISAGSATIRPVTSGSPHGGAQHLQFNANGVGASWSEYATVAVDLTNLTGRTDVNLDFWAKYAGGSYAYVLRGPERGRDQFVNVWSVSLATTYTHYTLDLDALARPRGLRGTGTCTSGSGTTTPAIQTTGVIWTTCGWWRGWTWRGRKCWRTRRRRWRRERAR